MTMDNEAFVALRAVSLFRDLSDDHVAALAQLSRRMDVQPGQRVIEEGATGASMYVISEGRVLVTKKGGHGQADDRIVAVGPGNYVGLNALVESTTRSANVVTGEEAAVLFEIRFDDLEGLLAADPSLSSAFWRSAARGLSRQLRRVTTDTVVLRALIRAQQD